jgi:tetratricopeptide (TPR) repeat protein
MSTSFVELQQAMKVQSEDLRDALADLTKWEQEVNNRPKSKMVAPDLPPVRGTAPLKKAEPAKPKIDPMLTAKEEGNEYFKRGDVEQAMRCYTKGIDVDPHNASAHVLYANRAQCYIKLRKWEEAEKDATVSVQMNRAYSKAFFRRAVARKGLKKYKDARSDLETVLALQAGDPEATNELKEVTQLLRAADAASGPAPAAAGAATRKKLVIKEVDEDDEEEEDKKSGTAPARHVDPTASISPNREQLEAARKQKEEEARSEKERQDRIDRDISHLAEQQKLQAEQRRQQGLKEEELKQRQRRANPRVEEVEDEPVPPPPAAAAAAAAVASSSSQPRTSVSVPSVKVQAWTKDKLKTPKNFTEFERVYADIRVDSELFDAYLALIAPSTFKSVFGSSLTPEMFVDLLEAAKRSTAIRAKELLEGLATVSRLDELVMFFEAKEKALVAEVFALISNSGAPKAAIEKLRTKFVA